MLKRNFAFALLCCAVGLVLFWNKNDKASARRSGAYEALQFQTIKRAYPNDDIPEAASYAAFEYAQQTLQASALRKNTASTPWQTLGPHNRGGRTLALAFNPQNPNTIYAGSASGGLWRSFTAGRGALAWERVAIGFPVLAVSSIAFAPNDSNTIYIGTGEVYNAQDARPGQVNRATRGTYGIGILKSHDGGRTWKKSLDWSYNQRRGVWAVKVHPLQPNVIWAATTDGTYRSDDAGETWRRAHNVIMAMDLVVHPADPNIAIVACGNFSSTGYGLYRTINGGLNWTKILAGVPTTYAGKGMLAIHPENPDVVMASFGNGFEPGVNNRSWLSRSEDAGATWSIVSTQDHAQWQGWFAHDVAMNPSNDSEMFVVGINVWKSTFAGSNLTQRSGGQAFRGIVAPGTAEGTALYVHVDLHEVIYHPTNHNVVYFGCDGGVFRTLDGGATFEACNGGYQTTQFYNGFTSSQRDSNLALGGLQDNNTVLYKGTVAWSVGHIGGDGGWSGIDANNDNILYGSGQVLTISKSLNGGNSWNPIRPPDANRPTIFEAPFVVGVDNPNVLYAGRDIVYKSTNAGQSWFETNNGFAIDNSSPFGNPVVALAVSPRNSNVVYAATAPLVAPRAGVFRTSDGGNSWIDLTNNLPDRFPSDLALDPNNDQKVYLTFSGFGTSHVFKSSNAGVMWEDIGAALPDIPTEAVVVDPLFPEHIYVGTDIGVFVSTDGGNTWHDFNEGFIDAVLVFDLSISSSNRKLRVATHGNGVFERPLLREPISGVDAPEVTLSNFSLKQNYPNPFNPETRIVFELPVASRVTLKVFDVSGREVAALAQQQQMAAGRHRFNFSGSGLASGVYYYRLEATALHGSTRPFVETKTMTLMR